MNIENKTLPRADEPNYVCDLKKQMIVYIVIGRAKDSDENPWIEFETSDHMMAKNKLNNLSLTNANRVYKIETRTIKGEELINFQQSNKIDKMFEEAVASGKIPS